MHTYKNIVIIGTSHIALESVKDVEKIITEQQPEVVALELDAARFQALTEKTKRKIKTSDIKKVGMKGWLFALLGEFVERKLGDKVGVSPGSEMLKAAEIAKKHDCKIALIDQRIDVTLKRFSKALTWKEKFRFAADLIKAPFSNKKIKINLSKVPEEQLIQDMILQVKDRYPSIYTVLVKERNEYMAKRLFHLMHQFTSIVAVVGAGHGKEIIEEIKKLELRSSP